MSRKQSVRSRPGKKAELERKRDERVARRAIAKERKNRAGEAEDTEEFVSFTNQLQALGLRIREVPGDGNCLYRALGDQLEGHSRNHLKHRQETVDYMIKHRSDFEPFVEDDVPFDRHVENLAQAGTFAGNDAIVAFARKNQVNVVIHQLNNPLWQIRGSDKAGTRELHIAYRYGEHYDSVRRTNDNAEAPANLQTQKLSKNDSNRKSKSKPTDERRGEAVQKVRNATGCADIHLILRSLEAESYNIESAIQSILQNEELKQTNCRSAESHPPTSAAPQPAKDQPQPPRKSGHPTQPEEQPHSQQTEPTAKQPEEGATEKQDENRDDRSQRVTTVSNKQRKEQQRLQKKKRQEERHRQRLQELRDGNTDNNRRQDEEAADVTVVKAYAALSI